MLSLRTITGYVFSTIEPQTIVRKATAYALVATPIVTTIRKATAYALTRPKTPLTKGKTSLEQLYALINSATLGTVFTTSNLAVTTIVAEKYQGYNTKVKVAATLQTIGYSGSTYMRYNRVPLSRSFEDSIEIGFAIVTDTTVYGLLSQLNTAHNLKLVPEDLVDGPIKANAKSLPLTAAATSYLYLPGSTILLGVPYVSLLDVVTVKDLPGFDAVIA